MGTGGIIPPPEGYWQEIQAVLERHDVLLVAAEVVTGFGRTGRYFGSHTYGMQPDLITIAKGLTSASLPLSGVIVGERVWPALEQGGDELGLLGPSRPHPPHTGCAA